MFDAPAKAKKMLFRTLRRVDAVVPRLVVVVSYCSVGGVLLMMRLFGPEIADRGQNMTRGMNPIATAQAEEHEKSLVATTSPLQTTIQSRSAHLEEIDTLIAKPIGYVEADAEVTRLRNEIQRVKEAVAEVSDELAKWLVERTAEDFGIDGRVVGRGPKSRYAASRVEIARAELKRLTEEQTSLETTLSRVRASSQSN